MRAKCSSKMFVEIATALGYKTHSAILKRIRKIRLKFQNFSSMDLGFDEE